jgi:hypothetical protein
VGQAFGARSWDRWPNESEKCHLRFKSFFLAQDPHPVHGRSLIEAYRRFLGGQRVRANGTRIKPPGRWSRQAKKFKWQERALDRDLHETERRAQEALAEMHRQLYEQDKDRVLREAWENRPDEFKTDNFKHIGFNQFKQAYLQAERAAAEARKANGGKA